ncbi:helix-turn-helix domain-containing protein [Tabrizicola sp.]|uniref:helix-turn-helix domain-containing protein n=1 Tax=Tabrizicola sp. TaxID=2005166 RepID=UPI003F40AA14
MLQREPAALVVPLMIGFQAPFGIALGRHPAESETYQSFAAGLTTRPALIRSCGQAACVQIDFTAIGARAFFGASLADMAEQIVPVDDLGDREIDCLRDRLAETPFPSARLDLAESFVARRLAQGVAPATPVQAAYHAILARDGQLRIGALAAALGWSRKHLSRRFVDEIGIGPKHVARIARFAAAGRMARGPARPGWAEIAAATGFADQAHLTREFRALSDRSPGDWLAAAW